MKYDMQMKGNDMSSFDPEAFENMVIEDSNEISFTPVPEGTYRGIISSTRMKDVTPSRGPNAGLTIPILEVIYMLEDNDGKLAELLKMEEPQVRQDIWLDITPQKTLAFGPNQNIALGRLRDACRMNEAGKPFTFKMLEGAGPLEIHVSVQTNEETGISYNRVNRVNAA